MPVLAPGRVGLGEPERGEVGHGTQPGGGGVLPVHREDQIARPEVRVLDVRGDLDSELCAQLEAAEFLVLGILLDQEPATGGMELRIHLDNRAANCQDPGDEIHVTEAQLG
jgi:hypothetical protein